MKTIDLKAQKPAQRYSKAFFEIISDKDPERILNEINEFLDKIETNDEIKNFFFHPIVPAEDKKDVILKGFSNFSKETVNFIFILLDSNRLDCLDEIRDSLIEKLNDKNKLLTMEVVLAIEADDNMKEYIKQRLENKFQSRVLINFKKDENIMGGMLIKIKDTIIDLSIKKKMENFKQL